MRTNDQGAVVNGLFHVVVEYVNSKYEEYTYPNPFPGPLESDAD